MKIKIIIGCLVILSGCVSGKDYSKLSLGSGDFIQKNQQAANSLYGQLLSENVRKNYPIIVSTVVNMNHLSQTSTFGRLVSEQVSARLTQLGYQIVEPKLRNDLLIREEGEFLITRDLKEIAKSLSAQAVVVGTYAENSNDVYVNIKVVQPDTNYVLAANSYAIPKAKDIKFMLQNE